MRNYELVVLLRQNITSNEVEKAIADISEMAKSNGLVAKKHEYWGLRSLAYPIAKNKKAHYGLIYFEGEQDHLEEVHRKLKLMPDLIRFLLIKIDKIPEDASPILNDKIAASKAAEAN